MTMEESAALLHNMSAPPKSVLKYSGLADLATKLGPGGSGVCSVRFNGIGVFGTPVRFILPPGPAAESPAGILRHLGIDPQLDAAAQLATLINARAKELPLPDGCAVIPVADSHRIIWSDALSALAILSKCSDSIWLRAKTPAFNAALARQQVTLLVPPLFASHLPEVSS